MSRNSITGNLKQPLLRDRNLPGIDWNIPEQLDLLSTFSYARELADLPRECPGNLGYYLES